MKKKRRKPKVSKKDAFEKYLEIIEDDELDSPLVEGGLERDVSELSQISVSYFYTHSGCVLRVRLRYGTFQTHIFGKSGVCGNQDSER